MCGTSAKTPVVDSVPRGEHQDRHRRAVRSQALADLDAVAPRQHHVQKNEVVVVDAGLVERCLSVERDVDGIRLFAKALR